MVMEESINNFLAASVFNIQKISKGNTATKNIRPFIQNMILDTANKKVDFTVAHIQEGSARPIDIISHVLKSDAGESNQIRIVKTKTILAPILN